MNSTPTFLRIASIASNDWAVIKTQILEALPAADAIELRLDYLNNIEITQIAKLKTMITLPVIFTLRKKSQGGFIALAEDKRLKLITLLAELSPDYFDIEYDVPKDWLVTLHQKFPKIKLIGSYHNFVDTPENLAQLLNEIVQPEFFAIKIATFAHSIQDALRLLIFLRKHQQSHRIIALAMGELGQISRILAPIFGGMATYACLDNASASAPGQLTLQEINSVYRVPQLNPNTAIYALLGDPVAQSPGHLFHNQAFAQLNENAVYVKCRVNAEHLAETMSLLRQLPVYGMSVTIPHKETIVPYLDALQGAAAILKIANTVKREQDIFIGYNTDATGAETVLTTQAERLQNRSCLILGAGGSAKALAYMLLAKKIEVTLCNRTLERAQVFAEKFGGKFIDFVTLFKQTDFPYDLVINTLPADAYLQQCKDWKIPLNKHGVAMDIILKPLETEFLKMAQAAGWKIITGAALYHAQAVDQLQIWFNKEAFT